MTGTRAKLGVELAADHPGMVGKLADFYQSAVGGQSTEDQPNLLEGIIEFIIKFIAVPVALIYQFLAVGPGRPATGD